jgi:PAS domain S-box-containing protein
VIIVLVATGAVMPTLRSAVISAVIGILGWLATAVHFLPADLLHWGVNVAGSGLVAIAITAARLRALADLRLSRFMTDRAHDAIYLVMPDGRMSYVNDAACRMLGYQRDELLRMKVADIDPSMASSAAWERTWALLVRRRSMVAASTHRARSGVAIPVELSFNMATLEGHEYACTIARDVTERRMIEEKLERARHAAEAASRAKSEFLATMSHEIRTPLNGVFGMTELALEATDEVERREFIHAARSSAETLLSMLNDILDYSQLEAGRLAIEVVDFDVAEIGRLVMNGLAADARRRGIDLRLVCAPELPRVARGDPRRLRQILTNLAVNALKFTERGDVEIRLACTTGDDARVSLLAEVRDTGIGIAAADLERIFEPFTQLEASHARRFAGVGLGLAIVRDLVHALGGTIEVTSTPHVGTTFRCRLPLAPPQGDDAASPPRAAAPEV